MICPVLPVKRRRGAGIPATSPIRGCPSVPGCKFHPCPPPADPLRFREDAFPRRRCSIPGTSFQRDRVEMEYLRLASAARPGVHGLVDALVCLYPPRGPDGRGTGSRKAQGTTGKGIPPLFSPVQPILVSCPGRIHRPDGPVRMGGNGSISTRTTSSGTPAFVNWSPARGPSFFRTETS